KAAGAVALIAALAFSTAAQTEPEVTSPLGAKFYSQPDDKNTIAEAERKLAADPRNIDLIIALGRAQAQLWRYRDAINTYTRGIEIDPRNAMLYRHRGHRYISTRQFDKATRDLERAARLNDKDYDILYHLGLVYYLKGRFDKAAVVYEKCRAVARDDDAVIAVSDWLYMTYRRMKKEREAASVLERITTAMKVVENKSYFDRLMFYKGLKTESDIVTDKLTDLEIATIGYGFGNWHLYNGNREKAKEYFQKIVGGKYWPAFGFIAAETELARMR
ncbi:MAG: tetratricopeptide repeat protein, partial [Acidobacteriota bacterium]